MTGKTILIVDDEADIVELLSYNLRKEGFTTVSARDGDEAFRVLRTRETDLAILDLMLPGISGLELCRLLRQNPKTRPIPIIMLTAKGEELDRVRGLDTGADDYMTKPFSPRELIARVKAVLRRTGQSDGGADIVSLGDLQINRKTYEVRKHGALVELSATEFRLLLFLVERKGRIFSREQLLDALWRDDSEVDPRTVDVHIRRLRSRIERDPSSPRFIKTRRGVGYYAEHDAK